MITTPGGSGMMSATLDYKLIFVKEIPKAIVYSLLSGTVLGFERNPNPIHDTHSTTFAFACVCCIGFLSLESRGREIRLLVLLCAVAAASRFCFGGSWCSRRKRTQHLWRWRKRSVLFLSFPSFVSFLYCCSWTRSLGRISWVGVHGQVRCRICWWCWLCLSASLLAALPLLLLLL